MMEYPGKQWTRVSPDEEGFDAGHLQEALDYLKSVSGSDGVREAMVISRGRVIWEGDRTDRVHGIWSCTKSFTSTCLGLLIDDGKCGLNTFAAKLAPELTANYPDVLLRHFATMTSGYRAVGDETTGSYTHGPSKTPFVPNERPLFSPPGSRYAYWDSAMNEFAYVLTQAADEPLNELFKRRIADPIGMDPAQWRWGDFGVVNGLVINGGAGNNSKHVFISARQLARLGHLFLNQGNWNGRQLISSDWVRQATSVQVGPDIRNAWSESEIDGPGAYGFNWWRNGRRADGRLQWPGAPESTYAASGYNNNKLFVIPDWSLVIVRTGLDQSEKKITDQEWGEFIKRIGRAREPKVNRNDL